MARQALYLAARIATIFTLSAIAQSPEELMINAYESVRSHLLDLRQGERLQVSLEGASADIFVHAEDKSLVARDDPETVTAPFVWTCSRAGKYYVLLRNVGAITGIARVMVQPPEPQPRAVTLSNYARVRLFYATDRQKTAEPELFGAESAPNNGMTYGVCEISIPRDHRMGEVESPTIWRLEFRQDPQYHVVLLSETLKNLDKSSFLRSVEERASTNRAHEALVFIHGFNTTFVDGARRLGQITYDLGFEGASILYSWPSQGRLSLQAYLKDGSNAELSTDSLATLLDDLRSRSGIRTVHLIAHSMGNRLLTSAMAKLATPNSSTPRFRQVALMAPDVRVETFRQLAEKFRGSAERITLYASSQDKALVASQQLNGYLRAGQGGEQIVVVPGVDSVDATSVDTSSLGLSHQYYGDSRTVLGDMFLLLRGKPPQERFGLQPSTSGTYWIFRQ